MGRCIDFIFQKCLLHYRHLVTQINVETSAKLFHKIFSKMNRFPLPVDVTFILSLCFISFSQTNINFKGKNVFLSDIEQNAMAFLDYHVQMKSTHQAKSTSKNHGSWSWNRMKFGKLKQNGLQIIMALLRSTP